MALRLGTRASALALWQARHVASLLGDDVEIVEITTTGDRARALVDKEKWVKELELALLAGEIDLAVHSAKDVPGTLPEGLDLLGAPARADARDALVGAASVAELPPGARVGTSSLRRAAQVRSAREDVTVVEIRGNVDTRLRKLADGEADALILAAAGLERLGRADAITAHLDFVPAPGQGVIALEGREDDPAAAEAARRITDRATWIALLCERTVVTELGATCHTPVGAHATLTSDDQLTADVFVGIPDGAMWIRDSVRGAVDRPEELGRVAAARGLAAGGQDLLDIAEGMTTPANGGMLSPGQQISAVHRGGEGS